MRKISVLLAFASAVIMAGCQNKEMDIPEPSEPSVYIPKAFSYTLEDLGTKASYGFNGEQNFGAFPMAAVYPGFASAYEYIAQDNTLTVYNDPNYATPSHDVTIPDNVAVYPYFGKNRESDNKIVCSYDDNFKYDSETGLYSITANIKSLDNIIVAATDGTDDTDFHFKNTQGILKLSLLAGYDGMILNSLTIKGNNDEIIAGEFKILFSHDHLPELVPFRDNSTQFYYSYSAALSKTEPTDIYINFPSTTFTKGITVLFETNYGDVTKKTTQPLNVLRSTIQPLTTLTLEPEIVNTEIHYITTDGKPFTPKTLSVTDPAGNELTYTNEYVDGEGVIRFDGIALNGDVSFEGATTLVTITSMTNNIAVSTCKDMFKECINLIDNNIMTWLGYHFSTEGVTDFSGMFEGCTSLRSVEPVNETMSVTSTARMFKGCTGLTRIGWSGYQYYPSATDMSEMFAGCTNATTVDFNRVGIGTKEVDMTDMFKGCSNLYFISATEQFGRYGQISEGTFEGVKENGCLVYPYGYNVGLVSWLGQGEHFLGYYGWNGYMPDSSFADPFDYNSVLWVDAEKIKVNGSTVCGYSLSGVNIASVKSLVFTKSEYSAGQEACNAEVVNNGVSCTSDEISKINLDRCSITSDFVFEDGEDYVLVTYYEGTGLRKDFIVSELSEVERSSLEDLNIDHKSNGNDYWN